MPQAWNVRDFAHGLTMVLKTFVSIALNCYPSLRKFHFTFLNYPIFKYSLTLLINLAHLISLNLLICKVKVHR